MSDPNGWMAFAYMLGIVKGGLLGYVYAHLVIKRKLREAMNARGIR